MNTPNQRRTIIITGAAGGIGLSLVAAFLERKDVVIAIDINTEALYPAFKQPISEKQLLIHAIDITDYQQLEALQKQLKNSLETPPTVLINAAGIFAKTPVIRANKDSIDKIIQVNLIGSMYCTEIFSQNMLKQRNGTIINIASVAGIHGTALASAYAASKAGLIAASKSYARELAPFGISVNTIAPGFCDTAMLTSDKAMIESSIVPRIPVQRLAYPEDITECVLFLANCKTDYLTGSVITLDGGLHVG